MGDNNVYTYDEINPIQHSQRDVLRYSSRSEDTTPYLVELTNTNLGAAPPSQTRRSRNSTIVNTSQIPDTIEEEEEPLESYIRKNLPSLRKSIVPESYPVSRRRAAEKGDNEGSVVVMPISVQDIQRDSFVNKQLSERKNVPSNEETVFPTTSHKQKKSNDSLDHSSEAITPAPAKTTSKNKKEKHGVYFKNEVIALPAISDPALVHQQSPFTKEQTESNRRPSSRVKVMIMIDSSDDETTEKEKRSGKEKKHHSNRDKSHTPSGRHTDAKDKKCPTKKKRRDKCPSEADMGEEETIYPYKGYIPKRSDPIYTGKTKTQDHSGRDQNRAKTSRHRGSQEDNHEQGGKRGAQSKQEVKHHGNRSDQHVYYSFDDVGHQKRGKYNASDAKTSRNSSESPNKQVNWTVMMAANGSSFPTSDKKGKKQVNDDRLLSDDESSDNDTNTPKKHPEVRHPGKVNKSTKNNARVDKRLVPEEDEDDYATKHQPDKNQGGKPSKDRKHYDKEKHNDKSRPTKNKPDKRKDKKHELVDSDAEGAMQRQESNEPPKYLTVKAPKSATKMVSKKRYLIQIPEQGREDTWFNIHFNMNEENNVGMDYEGPVKVINYYSSNTYK